MDDTTYSIRLSDESIRLAAIDRVRDLSQVYGDEIPWRAIEEGFELDGEKIFLANKAVGIFKPRQLEQGALSIKKTIPRVGRKNIYDDSEDEDGTFIYSLQGEDPSNHFNRELQVCWGKNLPLIYFHAVAESIYKAIYPCFIESVDLQNMNCRVSVSSDLISGNNIFYARDSEAWKIERRYALRETKARLHQADFRIQVLNAYGKRCSMTGLPVPQLLEAAHIVPDSHELGEASIQNGICLSRIHHRAFDSNLIGITPDYKILVSQKLLEINDGPILDSGIKLLHGQKLKLPRIRKNWPSQDLLSQRFEFFKKWSFVK